MADNFLDIDLRKVEEKLRREVKPLHVAELSCRELDLYTLVKTRVKRKAEIT